MPSQSSWNLLAFAQKLGLKDISQARINPNPDATIIAGDLSALTPQYRPPTAMFGANVQAVAAQFSSVWIQSLDPGGVIVKNSVFANTTKMMVLPLGTVLPAAAVNIAGTPWGEDPAGPMPASRFLRLNQVAQIIPGNDQVIGINLLSGRDNTNQPIVLAPGRLLVVESTAVAFNLSAAVMLQGVPVSGSI